MQTQQTQQTHYTKQIIEENKKINNVLHRVDLILDAVVNHHGDIQKSATILKEALLSLDRQLKHFFTLQEQHGILEDFKIDYPHIQHFVQDIYKEDNILAGLADKLYQEVSQYNQKTGLNQIKRLHKDYKKFIKQLKDHREKINDLVFETYNLDIGGKG